LGAVLDTHGAEKICAGDIIDRYVSKQNFLGTHYSTLSYLLGFSDCMELKAKALHFSGVPKKPAE